VLVLVLGLLLGGCAVLPIGPQARFDVDPVVLYVGEWATFDASSSRGSPSVASYDWSYGDGETGAGMRTEHRFEEPGVYDVTLVVSDGAGRADRRTRRYAVYVRSGTALLSETFDEGEDLDDGWPLDPSWASSADARLELVGGDHGYALRITSSEDRWHRRWREVRTPPLRSGQRIVFRCDVMTSQTQYDAGFWLFPLRPRLEDRLGALPFLEYSSERPGLAMVVVSPYGTELVDPLNTSPQIYRWSTYRIEYTLEGAQIYVDGVARGESTGELPLADGGSWLVVLGDESHELRCHTYFDNISLSIEE
jgi:PKD repeat protein